MTNQSLIKSLQLCKLKFMKKRLLLLPITKRSKKKKSNTPC